MNFVPLVMNLVYLVDEDCPNFDEKNPVSPAWSV